MLNIKYGLHLFSYNLFFKSNKQNKSLNEYGNGILPIEGYIQQ